MRVWFGAVALLVMGGCQDEEGRCASAADFPATLELGVGENAFQPVQEGGVVEVEFGMQGGSHLWISLAASGIVPGRKIPLKPPEDTPEVFLSLSLEDGTVIDEDLLWPQAWDGSAEYAELLGARLYPRYFEGVEDLEEVVVDLRAEVVDICGTELVDERRVRVTNWQTW